MSTDSLKHAAQESFNSNTKSCSDPNVSTGDWYPIGLIIADTHTQGVKDKNDSLW